MRRALSEQQIDVLADKYIIGLYQDLEDEVIADIARRVQKTGRYTETAEIMAKSMLENGFSADQIRVEVMKMLRADREYQMAVAENTMAYKREVQQIIDATVEAAKESGDTLTAEAGNMAWNNDLSMWKQQGEDLKKPNSLSKFVKASSLQTSGALRNLTKTMGFKNTALGTTGIMNMYQREMDLALIKVSTGTFSFDQAVKDCVHRLAQSGLRSIDYASGRSYQLDVAARMAVRTGMSQLSGKITEENLKNSNHDLVITTQHMGSRPDHAVWQNKVFSYSGKSKKYPDFVKETGYGTVTGLKGANCTHDFYPYWEGASVIPEDIKEPAPRTIGGKTYTYYESTQKQRQMERQIRATKREIEATKSIGGDTQELQSKLRGQLSDYTSFSKAAGLKERDNRLRVFTGTSNASIKINKPVHSELSIKDINKSGTENLLKAYDDRRLYFGLNETPADELKNTNTIKVDYDGVPANVAKAFNDTIQNLSKEYYTGFTKIKVGDKKEFFGVEIFATTQHMNAVGQKTLVLNPHKVGNYEKLVDRIKELSSKEYAVKIPEGLEEKYIATHEFAHSLIDLSGNYKNYIGMDVKQMKGIKKEMDSLFDSYKQKVIALEEEYKKKELKFINASFTADIDELNKLQSEASEAKRKLDSVKISKYSLESADEFMAEAFTQEKLSHISTEYSKKVLEILDKNFKKETLENIVKDSKIKTNLQYFASISEEKFTEYALNPLKAPDKAKAFETALGYTTENADDLIKNIKDHIDENKFVEKGDNGYGMRYEYIMKLKGANGKEANVLTAWIEQNGEKRLTSVYVTKKDVTV